MLSRAQGARDAMRSSIVFAFGLLAAAPAAQGSHCLYTWAMETRDPSTPMPTAPSMARDFLAVFGRLVATLPVGPRAQMAHHTNDVMPLDGRLFASDYMAGQGYIFDLRDPTRPRLTSSFGDDGAYAHPRRCERLPSGHTLATYQFKGAPTSSPVPWSSLTAYRPLLFLLLSR